MYCSKCGKITEQKSHNLFVCADGHDNWLNPTPGSTVYVIKNDQVLFGIRGIAPNTGKLCLPGGFIDLSETAEEAAVREAKEELGIVVQVIDYLGSYTSLYIGNRYVLNLVYIAEYVSGNMTPGDDMNGGDPVWRNINDLPAMHEVAWDWYEPSLKDLQNWWGKAR